MKRKIGFTIIGVALLAAILLQVMGSPAFAHVSKVTKQGGYVSVDNYWDVRWYAFVLLGLIFAGTIAAILPSRSRTSE